jgi:hypothetical protein
MRLLRLFNEEKGKKELVAYGVSEEMVNRLDLLGISGIGNMISLVPHNIESNVLLTEDGPEVLSPAARKLFVI